MKVDVLPGLAGPAETSWNGLLDHPARESASLAWPWHADWMRASAAGHPLSVLAVSEPNMRVHP